MFPLKDDNPTEIFPYVTIAIIAINVIVFIFQVASTGQGVNFTTQLAVIPVRFTYDMPPLTILSANRIFTINPYLTLFSYAFLHGGLFHLGFNMLFLWVFGNNIEDALGHIKFIIFYLLSGIAAALLHITMNPASTVQMIGASGAIAGVLGAYLVLFPYANIHTLFFIIIFIRVIKVPAIFFIGFWFFIQIMNATAAGAKSNVAWYAHIGGFVAGILLIMLFKPKKKKKARIVYH